MASAAMPPQGAQEQPQQNSAKAAIEEFRPLAEQVQALSGKYPEGGEAAGAILKLLTQWMTKVAGNQQRVPDKQAPPVG